jgi:hypothetical protein
MNTLEAAVNDRGHNFCHVERSRDILIILPRTGFTK